MINLIIFILAASSQIVQKPDLNRVSIEELYSLSIDSALAENIISYRFEHGGFRTFTDLMLVQNMDDASFELLLRKFSLTAAKSVDWRNLRIDELKDRLASEDDPGVSAIDYWENLLLFPLDLNRATVQQLNSLYGVSMIDASAVIRHRSRWGNYRYIGELRNVENLSSYGYRNIRYYVFEPSDSLSGRFWGIARFRSELENLRNEEGSLDGFRGELSQRILVLDDENSSIYQDLLLSGWTPQEIDSLKNSLSSDLETLQKTEKDFFGSFMIKGGYGDKYRAGMCLISSSSQNSPRVFFLAQNIGPIEKFIAGDYRLTFAEGLLLDNSPEFRARQTQRIRGIYPDLNQNEQYGFRGAAVEFNLKDIFYPTVFASYSPRNAVMSGEDTAVILFSLPWEIERFSDKVLEKFIGAGLSLRFDKYFPGSALESYIYRIEYDKHFNPDTSFLDIPGDRDNLEDANFLSCFKGMERTAYSLAGRTVFAGFCYLSFETAFQDNGKMAYIASSRFQKEFIYLDLLYRHYDPGFDNPYSRGFAEQRRFEDTEFEKTYRLLNPLYSYLQWDPVPKAEEGFYAETRFQITRNLTVTKAYIDVWKNLATGLDNFRSQGTVEYRFSYPMSLSLRQKWQNKKMQKVSFYSASVTNETELRIRFFLENGDYLSFSATRSQVLLSRREGKGNSEIISGYYLSGRYEHEFSEGFSVLGGMDIWNGEEMSMWEFEDMGIDFLYGHGIKSYIVARQRINENLFLRIKARHDLSYSPYYGSEGLYIHENTPLAKSGFEDVSSNLYLFLLADYRF